MEFPLFRRVRHMMDDFVEYLSYSVDYFLSFYI